MSCGLQRISINMWLLERGGQLVAYAELFPTTQRPMWRGTLRVATFLTHSSTVVPLAVLQRILKLRSTSTCPSVLWINKMEKILYPLGLRLTKLCSGGLSCPEDLKQYILRDSMGTYFCGYCHDFSNRSSTNVRNHCEAKHFPNTFIYTCKICSMIFGTNTGLYNHMARSHKKDKQ